ncbi:peptidyl-prolyl cis-trans isomerase A [uncultured Thiomicrorhabdus sp.]
MTRRLFLTLKALTLGALLSFSFNAAAQMENPQVLLETSKGNITLELNANKAPKSVANFLGYVNSGYYDGLIFHRVINGFMIQGGGLDESMKKKSSKAPIINEADNGLSNDRGTIAMARTGDPHSATSQFFINHKDNNFLNHTGKNSRGWGYAVFGKVTQGMDVVDAIAKVSTTRVNGRGDVPAKPIIIIKASQIK